MKTYSLENPFLDNSYLLAATDGSIKPIALIFLEIAEDGLAKIKNSNSTFQNVDISNNPNAEYTHDLIFNGTISIKIKAAGGQAVTIESTILTAEQLTEINNLIGGEMDSINGYTINLYQLIYKLILWEYINANYTITLKPFVIYANITNVNDNTTALNYTIPTTKITANKEVISITADPNLIIWSDGTIRNCENLESNYTGPGEGNIYLIGNYTTLKCSNQSINEVDFFSKNLEVLNFSSNAVNITTSLLSNIISLIELNLSNTNSTINDLSKFVNLKTINLINSSAAILNNSIQNNNVIENLEINNTNSVFDNNVLANKLQLIKLSVANTDSIIKNLNSNFLEFINVGNTLSELNPANPSTVLKFIAAFTNDSIFTDSSKSKFLNLDSIFGGNNTHVSLTDTTFLDLTKIVNLGLDKSDITINTSSIIGKNSLNRLEVQDCKGQITAVNAATKIINVSGLSNQTETSNNSLIQNLVDNTRTGIRQLTYDDSTGIDQSNINILTARGWQLIAIV